MAQSMQRPSSRVSVVSLAAVVAPVSMLIYASLRHDGAFEILSTLGAICSALVWLRVRTLVDDLDRRTLELTLLSRTDALTGLPNRRGWDEQYAAFFRRAALSGEPLSVVMLDLDRFKAYNDRHGHLGGDLLIQETVTAWARALRPQDLLARWGGEEFVACLPGCDGVEALTVAQRLLEVVPHGQTASAGLAVMDPLGTPEELVARADAALYGAKRTGRARAVLDGERPRTIVLPDHSDVVQISDGEEFVSR